VQHVNTWLANFWNEIAFIYLLGLPLAWFGNKTDDDAIVRAYISCQ
jgi:hypothetical protein